MRAMLLSMTGRVESKPLRLAAIPIPEISANEVRIKVTACGICRTDLHVVEGDLAERQMPIIPGHQVVGVIENIGSAVTGFSIGERVGVAWLHSTCGRCRFCVTGRENLCDNPEFTGWTRNGGFAEYIAAPFNFVYRIPDGFSDIQAAPLLCAGIIGYRALTKTGIREWTGSRLGIYGFGAAGHVCLQLARHWGADVYVATRDRERHQALARELGAVWVGDTFDKTPQELDAAIIFAPAGELVPTALESLDNGGTVVLGGIHMSPIPDLDYSLLYGERVVRSVANNTRGDGYAFLEEAASIPIKTAVRTFELGEANDALIALKNDAIRGAGVIVI